MERMGCCHNSYSHIPLRKISTLFIHRAKQINLYISKDTVSAFIFTFIFFLDFFLNTISDSEPNMRHNNKGLLRLHAWLADQWSQYCTHTCNCFAIHSQWCLNDQFQDVDMSQQLIHHLHLDSLHSKLFSLLFKTCYNEGQVCFW